MKFTWTNNRVGHDNVMSKINRCYVSKEWVDDPDISLYLEVLPRTISDHNPILLYISKLMFRTWGHSPFRHFQYWQDIIDYGDQVLSAWTVDTRGCAVIKLILKLEAIRKCGVKGIATGRRRQNKIKTISHEGQLLTETLEIFTACTDYFASLLGTTERSGCLPHTLAWGLTVLPKENADLLKPIRESEIAWAVMEADRDSAPGPDEFGNSFFQSNWLIV
ncbi:uncharacterized protein LOC116264345 [Nymphaea colorata]|uniref:uncharacterized protein LOC116264345 n=1 Tax=Nymphaea colorata TaxID=210225 RepID=UPI00129D917A|nr:uncharacterized protein LOC116264345 [Nymphaea colorata]